MSSCLQFSKQSRLHDLCKTCNRFSVMKIESVVVGNIFQNWIDRLLYDQPKQCSPKCKLLEPVNRHIFRYFYIDNRTTKNEVRWSWKYFCYVFVQYPGLMWWIILHDSNGVLESFNRHMFPWIRHVTVFFLYETILSNKLKATCLHKKWMLRFWKIWSYTSMESIGLFIRGSG